MALESPPPQIKEEESWTEECLIDELYLCLMKLKSYDKQAYDLIYRIPIHKPTPIFEIRISDLNGQVKKELDDRWGYKREIDYILKEAVGKIFENIDERYFLLSVKLQLVVEYSTILLSTTTARRRRRGGDHQSSSSCNTTAAKEEVIA